MDNQEIKVGDKVTIIALPPYVKTAEPMPMLRPSSCLNIGEEGEVVSRQPAGYWAIRFSQKAFLLESQYFVKTT